VANPGKGIKAGAAENVTGAPLAANAALGVEHVGERGEIGLEGIRHQVSGVSTDAALIASGQARRKVFLTEVGQRSRSL